MMIGIGTPSSQRQPDRMFASLQFVKQTLWAAKRCIFFEQAGT